MEALVQTEEPESGAVIVDCLKELVQKEGTMVRITQSQNPADIPTVSKAQMYSFLIVAFWN